VITYFRSTQAVAATLTMLVAMVRSVTSAEVLAEVRGDRSAAARQDALRARITTAATMVSCLDGPG
jgi:hypothetical protein